jgi:hypothetical protein
MQMLALVIVCENVHVKYRYYVCVLACYELETRS